MSIFDELRDMLDKSGDDFVKFYEKDNKAAGTRVRKAMQALKQKCQEVREDVQEKKKTMK